MNCDQSKRTTEVARITTVAGPQAQGIRVRDHVLLSVTTVINGTLVYILVDSIATRSFIDDKL